MKKIALILLMLALAVPQLRAQPEYMHYRHRYDNTYVPGMLRVSLSDNYPVTVAIDGRYYNRHGESFTVGGLPPGRHHLKVYAYESSGEGYGNAHLLYEGRINIFSNMLTSFVLDANSGQTDIRREPLDNNGNAYAQAPPADNGNYNEDNNNYNNNNGYDNQAQNYNSQQEPQQPAVEDNIHGGGVETPMAGTVYEKPAYPKISKAAVDELGVKVNAKVGDLEKMTLIKNALKKKAVSTNQLSLMMAWLSFESSRVELLQWAYDHTTDKEHYNRLKAQLTYESSKEDLDNFIIKNN